VVKFPPKLNFSFRVYNDSKIRDLLTPTEIVLTALRLVDPSLTSLELEQFNNIVKQNGNSLISLLESKNGQPSRFMKCLLFVYDALYYDENNPHGLPRILLESLRPQEEWDSKERSP
jgi:hypothetical protein